MEKRRAYGWAETWEIRLRSFTDFAWRQFALRFFRLYFCLHRNRSTGTVQWFSRERFATIYIMSVVINKARKWIINTIRDAIFVRHHLIIPPPIKFTHLSVYLLYNSSISFDHSFFSNIHILHIYIYIHMTKNYPRWSMTKEWTTSKLTCGKSSSSKRRTRLISRVRPRRLIDNLFSTAPPFFCVTFKGRRSEW